MSQASTSSRQPISPKYSGSMYDTTVMFSPAPSKIGPERVQPDELRAGEVQRDRRAGHVRDDQVVHDGVLLGEPQPA